MKKNRMMRLASILMIAVLMTTCTISGTFAKYTTEVTSQDTARVANWGFDRAGEVTLNLFDETYGHVAYQSENGDPSNLIAPGTEKKNIGFAFIQADATNKPEVDYTFKVSVDGSDCHSTIQANKNIIWYLDGAKAGTNGTWAELLAAIQALSGDASGTKTYVAGTVPAAFVNGATHTVGWEWLFEGAETYDHDGDPGTPQISQDAYDTLMGNAADLADVKLVITINATQID